METPRLVGMPVTADDLAFIVEVSNDERVTAMVGAGRTTSEVQERIEQWVRHWAEHGFGEWMFRERSSGERIGWGGLQHSTIGVGDRVTVGYMIRPEAWGRGYATEIATASIGHAFGVLGLDEVFASALASNAASRRVMEKVGLVFDCEIDHGNHIEVVYRVRR